MTIIPDNSLLLANQVDRPKNAENYGNMNDINKCRGLEASFLIAGFPINTGSLLNAGVVY